MLHGEELSAAYASADVFVMPSETETLGGCGLAKAGRLCAAGCGQRRACCDALSLPFLSSHASTSSLTCC